MSIFELILFVFIFTALVSNIIPVQKRWASGAYALAATATIPICILAYGARWQMWGAYALTAALVVAGVLRYAKKPGRKYIIKNRTFRATLCVFALMFFFFSVLMPALLPAAALPVT